MSSSNRKFYFFIAALMLVTFSTVFVTRSYANQNDGRLNRFTPLMPGLAVYCVDHLNNVSRTFEDGGIRVLLDDDLGGTEMLFAPAADILQAYEDILETKKPKVIARGPNGITLTMLTTGAFHLLGGFTNEGKRDVFMWEGCNRESRPAAAVEVAPQPTLTPTPDFTDL